MSANGEMRAVVVAGQGQLGVTMLPIPQPGPGQALLRVDACGVCGSDLHLLATGRLPEGTVMGHEFCGTVMAAGPGAAAREGERWVCLPVIPCHECAACASGHPRHCTAPRRIGVGGASGGYAEYAVIDCDVSLRAPDGVDAAALALCEPLGVGLHAIRRSSLRVGDSCAVVGTGCIGLMVLQGALLAGASEVTVVEPCTERAEAAEAFGATTVLRDPRQAAEYFASHPVDIAFECAGAAGSLQLAADAARRGGEVIGVGVRGEDTIRISAWFMKELTLRMSLEGSGEFDNALRLIEQGRVQPLPMVSRRVGLDELPGVVAEERRQRSEVKVLVLPG